MDRLLALVYVCTPYFAVGISIVALIVRRFEKKEAAAKELRTQFAKRDAADMLRIGTKIQRERWVYKLEKWKKSKGIKAALFAGAKLIDEMRAK